MLRSFLVAIWHDVVDFFDVPFKGVIVMLLFIGLILFEGYLRLYYPVWNREHWYLGLLPLFVLVVATRYLTQK